MALQDHAKEQVKGLATKIGSGVVGLIVAGGLMWFTPLIDRFVKPAKPLANFSSEESDDLLTVNFKNLSQNAKQAKWDFGDGSPLEIVAGSVTDVKHKFKKANTYKVKLVVQNVVDQEDSRESLIAVGVKPQILDLSIKPVNQKTKPFTAGVKIKFEATADLEAQLEWDFGDGIYRAGTDTMEQEFPLPGKHLVKVRAVVGHQKGAPSVQEIEVLSQNGLQTTGGTQLPGVAVSTGRNAPKAISVDVAVRSLLSANQVRQDRLYTVNLKGKAVASNLTETIRATPGYVIKSVKFEPATLKKSATVINESITTADDGKSASVKAQVTKVGQDYQLTVAVLYVEELDSSAVKESKAVITLPGTSTLELPIGSQYELEIKYRGQTLVKLNELPIKASEFSLDGKMYAVTCTKSNGRATLYLRLLPARLSQ